MRRIDRPPRSWAHGLAQYPLPLPPLNEQRRIVAAIEEHLSRLDAADAYLAASSKRVSGLRAASLDAALGGEWPTRSLGDIALTVRNGLFVSRPAASPPGVPIFRISAVRPMALDIGDIRYADVESSQAEPFLTREDDLLFTRYSGNAEYVGACARIPRMSEPVLHPDKLIRVVIDTSQAEPAFVELACSAGASREAIRSRRKTTAGQVGIAGGQLRTVPVPLPPLEEQRRIVARVEEQISAVNALRAAIERAQRRSALLRRAVLEWAFRGELVPQDPSDEPASVLLERIQVERAAAPPPSRRRRHATAYATGEAAEPAHEAPPRGQTALFNNWEDAVECAKCGGSMVRTGSCYTCRDCGTNTGCS